MKAADPTLRPATAERAPSPLPSDHERVARVELLLIGRDLLRGQVLEANVPVLAELVERRGARIRRITTVDDEPESIVAALREALQRNPRLVVTTGGLGPAADDQTLAAAAAALGLPLGLHVGAQEMVERAYQRLYRARLVHNAGMNLVREKMCRLPLNSTPLENRRGIAPGVLHRIAGRGSVLCLPGRPEELRGMLKEAEELLAAVLPETPWARREIEAPTPDESALRPLLDRLAVEFPGVTISSRPVGRTRQDAKVLIFIEALAATREEAGSAVNQVVRRLLALASGSP